MNIKEMIEQLNKQKEELRAALKTDKNINLEEMQKKIDEIEKQEKELRMKQEMEEKLNKSMTVIEKPVQKRVTSLRETAEYRNAFFNYLRTGEMPQEYRDATLVTDIGAAIPTATLNKIIERIEASGMILPMVTKTTYNCGVSIPVASVKPVASWVADGAGSPNQKQKLTAIVFANNKLRCSVAVSINADVQAISAFEALLVKNIADAMTKALEQAIINGTGSGQPKGILQEVTTGNSQTVAKIGYDTLTNAEAALPVEYESGAVWVMTKKTFMSFIAMTDAQGQPIARVNYGINGAAERSLLGRKVVICNYLKSFDVAGAGDVFAFLFDFSDYILNTAYNVSLKQYEDNETDDIIRKAIMLADGKVIDSNSLVALKHK